MRTLRSFCGFIFLFSFVLCGFSPCQQKQFSQKTTNKVFISFGGPAPLYHRLVEVACERALGFDFFTHIIGFTDVDLKQDRNFWEKHGDFIETHQRGYGYWLWKPYLIHRTLEQLNDGDILIYADAGCLINPEGVERLEQYAEQLKNSEYGILTYALGFPERGYNKNLVTRFFGATKQELDSAQMSAAVVMIRKTKHSTEFVNRWYALAQQHELIDDLKGGHVEDPAFVDHRHDQAIYSLLIKRYGADVLADNMFHRFSSNWKQMPFQGTQSKPQTPDILAHNVSPLIHVSLEKVVGDFFSSKKFLKKTFLCDVMNRTNSDKSNYHNYTTLYSALFGNYRAERLNVFEMGLGTNYLDVPSNMGLSGTPGASLLGWAEYFPTSQIYGADIDKRILFQKDRISTFYCDQCDQLEIANMFANHALKDVLYDVIIDDGLHEFDANVSFFYSAVSRLKEGGIYIIEDLKPDVFRKLSASVPGLKAVFRGVVCCKIPTGDAILDGPYGDNALFIVQK